MKRIKFKAASTTDKLFRIDFDNMISQKCETVEPGEIVHLLFMNIAKNVIIPITPTKFKYIRSPSLSIIFTNNTNRNLYVYPGDNASKLLGNKKYRTL